MFGFAMNVILAALGLALLGLFFFYVLPDRRYRRTAYYRVTHTPYYVLLFDKSYAGQGRYGEYLTYKWLRYYEHDGCRFLFNLFIPKEGGGTTEIDMVMITPNGLIVLESKHYGGWIYGDEWQTQWCQVMPNGQKHLFYSPILQNEMHIHNLRLLCGEDIPFWSVIVFSDHCELREYPTDMAAVALCNRRYSDRMVRDILKETEPVLEPEKTEALYELLYPYSQVTARKKQEHRERVGRFKK